MQVNDRRFHSRYVTPYIIGAALLLCALAVKSFGQWHYYKPAGSVDGQGIHREVMSRCPQYMLRQIGSFDKATQAHEATHAINGEISQRSSLSYGAFYVGDGKCFIVATAPNVTVGVVAQYVPQELRGHLYELYLSGDRTGRNCLTLIDEWTCYANDAQATRELSLQDDGGLKNARQFSQYADILVSAVEKHDPSYAGMQRLKQFVAWQKARVEKLAGGRERSVLMRGEDPKPVDLAPEWRELNTDGSCVHIAYANSMRWLGLHKRADEYRSRYRGGESPGPHKRKLDAFGAKYAMTTDGDPKLIEYAIANRRMVAWTDMAMHYRNLMGRENGQAVLMGNGLQGRKEYQRIPWEQAMRAFNQQGGWAVVCLEGCPSPPTPE